MFKALLPFLTKKGFQRSVKNFSSKPYFRFSNGFLVTTSLKNFSPQSSRIPNFHRYFSTVKSQLASAKSQLSELSTAEQKLEIAEQELSTAKQKLATAKQKFEIAKQEFEIAQQNLDSDPKNLTLITLRDLALRYLEGTESEVNSIRSRVIQAESIVISLMNKVKSSQLSVLNSKAIENLLGDNLRKNDLNKFSLVSSLGTLFKLENRKKAQELLSGAVLKRFKAWEVDNVDKQNHPVPICASGPGVGKSRLSQEGLSLIREYYEHKKVDGSIVKLQQYLENAVQIFVSFENGGTPSTTSKEGLGNWSVETMISFRILWSYFIYPRYPTLSSWLDSLNISENVVLPLNTTLKFIADQTKSKCIYLGIDEFQNVVDKPTFSEFISNLCLIMREKGFYLIPFFSGITEREITSIISKSKAVPQLLPTPYLPLRSFEEIMDNLKFYTKSKDELIKLNEYREILKWKWRTSIKFRQTLLDVGGHPRAFELFMDLVTTAMEKRNLNSLDNFDYVSLKVDLIGRLRSRYPDLENKYAILKWICILQKEVAFSDVPPNFKITFQELSERGFIYLDMNTMKIDVPAIFLQVANILHKTVLDDEMDWRDFEKIVAEYLNLRLIAFKEIENKIYIPINVLFPGAIFNFSIKSTTFLCPEKFSETIKKSASRISGREEKLDYGIPIEYGDVILNGVGAKSDSLIVLQESKTKKKIVAHIQNKHYRVTELNEEMVIKEYEKVQKLMGQDPFILAIITTANTDHLKDFVEKTKEYPNLLLIGRNQVREFFGPLFADRAIFIGTLEINVNLVGKEQLREIPQIGEKWANLIIEEREKNPFKNLEDLKKRIPQLKDLKEGDVVF